MTNEELVLKIKSGQTEYIPELWDNVAKFIDMQAGKCLDSFPNYYRALRDDMVNQSYFYFLKAIDGYKEQGHKFTTYLDYHLKNAFTEVLCNGRSSRLKNDPLNQAVSVDMPISDTEDLTLVDTLIDETSEAYFKHIEDVSFWDSVDRLLNDAIDHVTNQQGRSLARYMLQHNCKVTEAAKALYGEKAKSSMYEHYRKAIRQMSHYMRFSTIKKQMKSIGLDDYIHGYGTGIRSFKRHTFTSSVELEVMRKVDSDMKRSDVLEVIL